VVTDDDRPRFRCLCTLSTGDLSKAKYRVLGDGGHIDNHVPPVNYSKSVVSMSVKTVSNRTSSDYHPSHHLVYSGYIAYLNTCFVDFFMV